MILEINEDELQLLYRTVCQKEFKTGEHLNSENDFPYVKMTEYEKRKAKKEYEIWSSLKEKMKNLKKI